MTANVFSCNFHEFFRRSCTVDAAATAQQEEQIYFQAEKSQKVISSTPIRLQNSSNEWSLLQYPFAAGSGNYRMIIEDAPLKVYVTVIREGCHGAGLDVECLWCRNLIRFDGLSRRMVNSHLHVNAVGCECGGTYSRGYQPRNKAPHEQSRAHQTWLRSQAAAVEDEAIDDGEPIQVADGSVRRSKRRRKG